MLHYIEGPKNILAGNLSQLHRLVTPAQLTEGKDLVEPAVVSDNEDNDDAYFLDQMQSGVCDEDIENCCPYSRSRQLDVRPTGAHHSAL